ncbi:hypothetical protein Hanom_Chr15g01350621 [Helianthus anomalus]
MAMAATHMMTIALRMKTGEEDLLLSPDAILKHVYPVDGLDPYRLEFFLRDLGIEERFLSEIVRGAAPDHQYDSTDTRRLWKIAKFDKYDKLSTIVMTLKKNFGPHGRQYPVLACCYQMEPLTSEEAAQTSMSEPHRFETYNSVLTVTRTS